MILHPFSGDVNLVDSDFRQLIRDPEVLDIDGKLSLHSQVVAAELQV